MAHLSASHRRALQRAAEKSIRYCEWRLSDPDEGTWSTSCMCDFAILCGTPKQNDMRFCCYCGDPIREIVING
jgi:hypothetical protein